MTYSDPFGNGAATLVGTGTNVITLGNGDTVQDITISGGTNDIGGTSITGADINHDILTGAGGTSIILTTSMGTVQIQDNTITSGGVGVSTTDNGASTPLVLQLDGNTITSGSSDLAMSIFGSAANSTIVQSMNGGTIVGGAGTGGVEFYQVTFDASGAALSGTTVDAGNWTLGTTNARVEGNGLIIYGPSGNLSFGTLNIAIDHGVGLYADTTLNNTSFSLSNTGGTIDVTTGQAAALDGIAADLTFASITETSGSNGFCRLLYKRNTQFGRCQRDGYWRKQGAFSPEFERQCDRRHCDNQWWRCRSGLRDRQPGTSRRRARRISATCNRA